MTTKTQAHKNTTDPPSTTRNSKKEFLNEFKVVYNSTRNLEELIPRTEKLVAEWKRKISDSLANKEWPIKFDWWNKPKWIKEKCKQYQYLEPILIELNRHKLKERECRKIFDDQGIFEPREEGKPDALIKVSWKDFAENIGCSESTARKYLTALVKTDILVMHNFGKAGRYFAIGYWGSYYDPNDKDKVARSRVMKLLTGKTVNKLKNLKIDF